MTLKFYCLNCGEEIITTSLKRGEEVQCKNCGVNVTIPQYATETDLKDIKSDDKSITNPPTNQKRNRNRKIQVLPLFCKVIILICFIALLWTFLFPTCSNGDRYFVFGSLSGYYQHEKIDMSLLWVRTIILVSIIGAVIIFLKWRASKNST